MRSLKPLQVGERVRYSADFLRAIGCYTGDMPQAVGVVVALKTLSPETILAEVKWNLPDLPDHIHVANLERIKG